MTPRAQQKAIAEACHFDLYVIVKQGLYYRPEAGGYTGSLLEAWKLPKDAAKQYEMYTDDPNIPNCEKVLIEPAPLPDYLHDLNAMNGAEMTLTDEQYQKFEDYLFDACDRETLPPKWIRWGSAKASLRARSFLQAIEKWEEGE